MSGFLLSQNYQSLEFILTQDTLVDKLISVSNEINEHIDIYQRNIAFRQAYMIYGKTETLHELSSYESMIATIAKGAREFVNWIIQKLKELYLLIKQYLKLIKDRLFPSIPHDLIVTKGDLEVLLESIPVKYIIVPFDQPSIYSCLNQISTTIYNHSVSDLYSAHMYYESLCKTLQSSITRTCSTYTTLRDLYVVLYFASSIKNKSVEYLDLTTRLLQQFLSDVDESMTPSELIAHYKQLRANYINFPDIKYAGKSDTDTLKEIVGILKERISFMKRISECLTPFIDRANQLYHKQGIHIRVTLPFNPDLASYLKNKFNSSFDVRSITITSDDPEAWEHILGHPIDNRTGAWCYVKQGVKAVDLYVNVHFLYKLERSLFGFKKLIRSDIAETTFLCCIVHECVHLCDAFEFREFSGHDKNHDDRPHEDRANRAEEEYVKNIPKDHIVWAKDVLSRVKKEIKQKCR